MPAIKFQTPKSIIEILGQTVESANGGYYDLLHSPEKGEPKKVTKLEQIRLDREWQFTLSDCDFYAHAHGRLTPIGGSKWELSWTGYGFAQDPPNYKLAGGKTGPTQVYYEGAWNGLCESMLMPRGITHPLEGKGTKCRISGVTGFPASCEFTLAQYLAHRAYNAEWLRLQGKAAAEAVKAAETALGRAEYKLEQFDREEAMYQQGMEARFDKQGLNARRKVAKGLRQPLLEAVRAAEAEVERVKEQAEAGRAPEPKNILADVRLKPLIAAVRAAIAKPSKEAWDAAHNIRRALTGPFDLETMGRSDIVGAVKAALLNL